MNIIFLLVALLLYVQYSHATTPLQKMAKKLQKTTSVPGLAIGISQGEKIKISVTGVRRIRSNNLIRQDDPWHIGSIGKSMTATLVARLVERGHIKFEDKIGDVLGSKIPGMHREFRNVTYRELLSHRSGIVRDIEKSLGLKLVGCLKDRDIVADRLRVARSVLARSPASAPGTAFQYSNAGYVVAGAMLEEKTGKTWEHLILREVFYPLGMYSAGFGAPGVVGRVTTPRGHFLSQKGSIRPIEPRCISDNPPAYGPAGTLHVNIRDLLKYLRAHMREKVGFLSKRSWDELHTPAEGFNYAAGWVVNREIFAHDGSNTLWYAIVAFSKEDDRAVAICGNYLGSLDGDVPRKFGEVLRGVLLHSNATERFQHLDV